MSPQEIAQRQARIDAADQQECMRLGFRLKTEGFSNCLLKMREIRSQQNLADSYNRAAMGMQFRYDRYRDW